MTGGFRYLNREGTWEGWNRHGIDVTPDGAAQLALPPAPDSTIPVYQARDSCGGIWYFAGNALLYRDCQGEVNEIPVKVDGLRLNAPAGLSYFPKRDAIVIDDRGNGRTIFLGRVTYTVLEVIHSEDPVTVPQAAAKAEVTHTWATSGSMWTGPITTTQPLTIWHTLCATTEYTGPACEIRLFWAISEAGAPTVAPDTADPFLAPWHSLPPGATDGFLNRYQGGPLYIGVHLTGDGSATPLLKQLRVDFNRDSWLPFLPDIYRRPVYATDPKERDDFLLRYLSLFESVTDDAGRRIDSLAALFDSAAAPPDDLDWLAGLLNAYIEEAWPENRKREAIALAFGRYGRRGTPAAIREALRFEAGINAVIEEPARMAGCWALPARSEACGPEFANVWIGGEDSLLGFTTMTASAEPQGAVLDSTATLDRSNLIADEDFGAPLFEDVVHRFCVKIIGSQSPDVKRQVESILEREAPAHTAWNLDTESSAFMVGYSSRVGVDTLLPARQLQASELGEKELVLAGTAAMALGKGAAVGRTIRL